MATNWTADLIGLSDQAWSRLWQRFDAMSDDEYLWEPAAGCWSITQRPDGTWTEDFVLPQPQPAPFTTIAWRMWHLIDMYGENRAAEFLGVEPQGQAIGVDDPDGAPPSTASEALELLELAHDRWDAHLALVTDDALARPRRLVRPLGSRSLHGHARRADLLERPDPASSGRGGR